MSQVRIAHTADLDSGTLVAARALLATVFHAEFAYEDWEHCLGGMHAMVWDQGELVGHGCVIQRRLLHRGRALRAGYVEGVGVSAQHRGRGHGATLMDALEKIIRAAYDLGALGSTEAASSFYEARGWRRWAGPTSTLSPRGIERTPGEDGWIYVLPVTVDLDLSGDLTCNWRDGDVW